MQMEKLNCKAADYQPSLCGQGISFEPKGEYRLDARPQTEVLEPVQDRVAIEDPFDLSSLSLSNVAVG